MQTDKVTITRKIAAICCLLVVAAAAAVVIYGRAHKAPTAANSSSNSMAVSCGRVDDQHLKCEHAHIRSLLGLKEEFLADKSRFPPRMGHLAHLDKPLFGCTEASIGLDAMVPEPSNEGSDSRRLRSVELKRVFPEETTFDTFLCEAKSVINEIAELLGVGTPSLELADVAAWRKRYGHHMMGGIKTSIYFDLADGQEIAVRLLEACYVIRDGEPLLVSPYGVNVDIIYNRKLHNIGAGFDLQEETSGGTNVKDNVKIEKELDIGTGCADKWMSSVRTGVSIESLLKAARRRGPAKPQP